MILSKNTAVAKKKITAIAKKIMDYAQNRGIHGDFLTALMLNIARYFA